MHIFEIPSYDVNEPRSTDRPRLLKQDDSLVSLISVVSVSSLQFWKQKTKHSELADMITSGDEPTRYVLNASSFRAEPGLQAYALLSAGGDV